MKNLYKPLLGLVVSLCLHPIFAQTSGLAAPGNHTTNAIQKGTAGNGMGDSSLVDNGVSVTTLETGVFGGLSTTSTTGSGVVPMTFGTGLHPIAQPANSAGWKGPLGTVSVPYYFSPCTAWAGGILSAPAPSTDTNSDNSAVVCAATLTDITSLTGTGATAASNLGLTGQFDAYGSAGYVQDFPLGPYVSRVITGCTVAGVTYTKAVDCMNATADAYTTAHACAPVTLLIPTGTWQHDYEITQGGCNYSTSTKNIKGTGLGNTILQATTDMLYQIGHPKGSLTSANGAVNVSDLSLDANFHASSCLSEHFSDYAYIHDVNCINPNWSNDAGYGNIPIDLGSLAANTGNGDLHVERANANGSNHGGQASGMPTQIEAIHTEGGPITGWQVMLQVVPGTAGVTVTAGGSGGTNGTFPFTTTGGGCRIQPFGNLTVSGGAVVSGSATFLGQACTGTPTIVPGGSFSTTGYTLSLNMNTGRQHIGVPLVTVPATPAIPIVAVIGGHGDAAGGGEYPCTTMPTKFTSGKLIGSLTNPPTVNFDANNAVTTVVPLDTTVASQGAGCYGVITLTLMESPFQYGMTLNSPDSHYVDLVSTTGTSACIQIASGGGVIDHPHPYATGCKNGIENTGNNIYNNVEFDSPLSGGMHIINGSPIVNSWSMTYNASGNGTGSAAFVFGAGAGSGPVIGLGLSSPPVDSTQYNKYVCATGLCANVGFPANGRIDTLGGVGEPPLPGQPTGSTPLVFQASTAAIGATVIYTATASVQKTVEIHAAISCDVAATGTSSVNVQYYDSSNTLHALTAGINCATLGTASVGNLDQTVRIRPNTSIKAYVTNSTATVSGSVHVKLDSAY